MVTKLKSLSLMAALAMIDTLSTSSVLHGRPRHKLPASDKSL